MFRGAGEPPLVFAIGEVPGQPVWSIHRHLPSENVPVVLPAVNLNRPTWPTLVKIPSNRSPSEMPAMMPFAP